MCARLHCAKPPKRQSPTHSFTSTHLCPPSEPKLVICGLQEAGAPPWSVLRNADAALYLSKESFLRFCSYCIVVYSSQSVCVWKQDRPSIKVWISDSESEMCIVARNEHASGANEGSCTSGIKIKLPVRQSWHRLVFFQNSAGDI